MLGSKAHSLFLDSLNGIAGPARKVIIPTYALLGGGLVS
jgi:hypothetical protein